jgi:integrase
MASFKQRGDTWTFIIDLGRKDGKRQQKSYGGYESEKAARKACDKIEREIEAGKKIHSLTLEEFITNFFETKVRNQITDSSYNDQWIMVKKYIVPKLGKFKIDKLTVEQIDNYYDGLLNDGVSRGYIKNIAMVLRKTLKQALIWNYVVKNVAREAVPPSYKPKKVECWTEEQLIFFLENSRDLDRHVLYVLGANSGMRIGEMLALQWTDIDFVRNSLSVIKSLKYTKKNGLYLKNTKTDNSERTIILPESVMQALQEYKNVQILETPIVFHNFGEYIYPSEAWREFIKDCKDLNMKRIKLHGLRHTHATILLNKGYNAKVVAERLGDTVETVLRTYAHVLPSMQQDVANSLSNLYKKA